MEKEKERRRQLGRERRDKYHKENEIHHHHNQPSHYHPPEMESHAHTRPPADPYNNASTYPVDNSRHPDMEKQYPNATPAHPTTHQRNKGLFEKAKDKVKEYIR